MVSAPTLFEVPPHFDGATYEQKHDEARLGRQFEAVKAYMLNHEWVTLPELQCALGGSEAGLSARLRDLRKPRFGGYTVDRKRIDAGLFAYRVRR